ncbi:putative ribonuclease H-like domain-containing protein [Tanacetum coccineum]|uniref:Ribonuclease H-like domain-containing protein n=1 Tax=Tanacetum coccineum TaxID=301880 RepID=A0ABQ4ZEN8_9ASTR
MTAPSTSSNNDINTAKPAYEVSTASPNVNTASPQVTTATFSDNAKDDLEAMDLKWQLSLLSMRAKRYYQRTDKKIFINANDTVGYDKSKVECFNCHKMGHFAKKYRGSRIKEATYKRGLPTLEEQLITYRKNEVLFSEEVSVLKRDVACKHYEINMLKSEFEKVKQEKEGIEFKIEKFDKASKDLNQLLESQITDKNKKGLGYGTKDGKNESNIVCDKTSDASKDNSDGSLVKGQALEDSFVESSLNNHKETVFPDKKKESVKPKNHEKPVKKSVRASHNRMTHDLNLKVGIFIMARGEHGGRISGKRTLKIDSLDFEDVYFVNELKFNLFSVSQMCDKKNYVLFTDSENKPMIKGNGPKWLFDIDSLTQSMNYVPVAAVQEVNTSSFKLHTVDQSVNTASSNNQDSPKDIFKMGASHTLEATHVEFFSDEDEPEVDLGNILTSYTIEPTSIAKALSDSSWVEAMQEELLQFKLQQVWILMDLPFGKRSIGTKWVFRNKKDKRGIVIRNKARFVAQGHRQEEGIDYDKVFAPVARIEAIRLFLAYAFFFFLHSFMGFMVYQMDVKSAFLYGTIEEEVYVTQPPGFKDPDHPDKVYKVVKALYGLHQAPRAWYETLANYLLDNGFKRGKIDQTLFIKKQKGDILLVQIYDWALMYLTTSRPDIMFVCKKKTIVATSTTEGEYMVAVPTSKTLCLNDNSSAIFESMPLPRISDVGGLVCRFDVLEGLVVAVALLGKRRGHVAPFLAMERSKLLGNLLRDI